LDGTWRNPGPLRERQIPARVAVPPRDPGHRGQSPKAAAVDNPSRQDSATRAHTSRRHSEKWVVGAGKRRTWASLSHELAGQPLGYPDNLIFRELSVASAPVPNSLDELHGGPVVLACLAGEAGDDVGPQPQDRHAVDNLEGPRTIHLPGVSVSDHCPDNLPGKPHGVYENPGTVDHAESTAEARNPPCPLSVRHGFRHGFGWRDRLDACRGLRSHKFPGTGEGNRAVGRHGAPQPPRRPAKVGPSMLAGLPQ